MKDPKIYVDAYQLTILLFNRTKNFSKQLRPSLAREIEGSCLRLLMTLRRALISNINARVKLLQKSSGFLDDLKILLQLSFELKAISPGSFQEISLLTREVGRELGGLIKHDVKKARNHATL